MHFIIKYVFFYCIIILMNIKQIKLLKCFSLCLLEITAVFNIIGNVVCYFKFSDNIFGWYIITILFTVLFVWFNYKIMSAFVLKHSHASPNI